MTDLKYFLLCILGFALLVTGICVYFLSIDEQHVAAYNNCVNSYDSCASTYSKFYNDYKSNCNSCLRNSDPSPRIYPLYDPYVYIGDVNAGISLFSIGSALILITFPVMTYRLVRKSRSNFTETIVQTEQHQGRLSIFYTLGKRIINIFRRTRSITNNQENVDAELTEVVGEEQPNVNTGESQVLEIIEIESHSLEQEVETRSTEKEENLIRRREEFTQLINDTKEKLDSVLQVRLDNLLEAHEELCKNDNPFATKQLEKARGELSSKLNLQEITSLLDRQKELVELESLATDN